MMLFLRSILIVVLLSIIGASSIYAQTKFLPRIFYVGNIIVDSWHDRLYDNGLTKIEYLHDSKYLGQLNDFKFSKKFLLEELNRLFPNPTDTGYAYLDIEDPYMQMLMDDDVTSERFLKSLKLYMDVLETAQKYRPNIKWGFYGIPFTTYWNRDSTFYQKNEKIKTLLNRVDLFYPSLYIFYNKSDFYLENSGYLKENIAEMIKLSTLYNKPNYVFIMSRYHPSNGERRFQNIDNVSFSLYVDIIFSSQYHDKNIDGLVLWNVDDYYFYEAREPAIADDFYKSRKRDFYDFYKSYLEGRLNMIHDQLERHR